MINVTKGLNNYLVGAYERLSKDDGNDESSSINSQKMIIESFALFNNFKIIKHYYDDGFTGSNFNRPGFLALKKDIEAKKINCVIVKDLSRLGRQLYETGSYIEDYFLAKQVRFIAINDGYDSLVGDSMLGIRLSVNDLYLRDTSKKIRSSLDVKRKNGEYIGSMVKYGYQKDPDNPKHLIIDPKVAWVIRQIFDWLASGIGTSQIAARLTSLQVAIPSIYKQEKRAYNQSKLNQGQGIWRSQTVRNIAVDQMYLGHMVQGRYQKLSYNSKKLIELPQDQWIIVRNTHEPLISQEIFDQAQLTLQKANKYRAKHEKRYLFQGLLRCRECGHSISIYQKKLKNGISLWCECNYYTKYSKYHLCTSHRLNYLKLEQEIVAYLSRIGNKFFKQYQNDKLFKQLEERLKQSSQSQFALLKKIKSLIDKNEAILIKLYDDRLNDIISVKQYQQLANQYKNKIATLKKQKREIEKQQQEKQTFSLSKLMETYMSLKQLDNQLTYQLIDRIVIDRNKNVEVFFKVDLQKYLD